MPSPLFLALAALGAGVGISCIIANALRKCGEDIAQDVAEGSWDFTIADVELASRIFHDEESR